MNDLDDFANARGRLTGGDVAIFDVALEALQSMPAAPRALVEAILCRAGSVKGPELAAWMLPHDAQPWAAAYLLKASTCAMTRERGLEIAGVDAPFARRPYVTRIGTALSAEIAFARAHGAWVDATHWTEGGLLPDLGDGVVIGLPGPGTPGVWSKGAGYGGAHIFTALHADGDLLHSVDGGQGAPDIALRTREIVEVPGELWMGIVGAPRDAADMRPSRGRRVLGWIQTGKLPLVAPPVEVSPIADTLPPPGDA